MRRTLLNVSRMSLTLWLGISCLAAEHPVGRPTPLVSRNTVGTQTASASLGFVFDESSRRFRRVHGIPGIAAVEDPADFGVWISSAVVSRNQNYAIATIEDHLAVVSLTGSQRPIQRLTGVSPTDEFRLSPLGSSAVFLDRQSGSMRVFTGLPESFTLDHELSVPRGTNPTALAVSDDGRFVLASSTESAGGELVSAFDASGASNQIATVGRAAAIEFLPNSHTNLIADSKTNRILLQRETNAGFESTAILTSTAGIDSPLALQTSLDGSRVFIANAASVLAYDLSSGRTVTRTCDFAVKGLYPLAGNAVFRLTPTSSSPLWLVDGGADNLRISFAPNVNQGTAPIERRAEGERR
jgi:DNA-binding beta-propeller fold protein YncE